MLQNRCVLISFLSMRSLEYIRVLSTVFGSLHVCEVFGRCTTVQVISYCSFAESKFRVQVSGFRVEFIYIYIYAEFVGFGLESSSLL